MQVDRRITVLYAPDDITLMYSLYPLLTRKTGGLFVYLKDAMSAVTTPVSRIILIMRYQKLRKSISDEKAFLSRLRDTYERIIYFDDDAMPLTFNLDLLKLADLYYKKQLPANKDLLFQPIHSGRLYSHHYREVFGISDAPSQDPVSLPTPEHLSKVRLSWNLGIGSYPRSMKRKLLAQKAEELLGPKAASVFFNTPPGGRCPSPAGSLISARFATSFNAPTVAHHRELFEQAVEELPSVRRGKTRLSRYNDEMRRSIVTISPFGWGEICFRDFEAMVYGSVLVKPDMSHIETWPAVYVRDKSYVAVKWDASDVKQKVDTLVDDVQSRRQIAETAFDVWSDAYRHLSERVDEFISEAIG